jgi:hypothetical protein
MADEQPLDAAAVFAERIRKFVDSYGAVVSVSDVEPLMAEAPSAFGSVPVDSARRFAFEVNGRIFDVAVTPQEKTA